MANVLIEGPVQLSGAGFVAKENGNYQPGEFKRLCNMEIDSQGFIKNRRNVYSADNTAVGAVRPPLTNACKIIGFMEDYVVVSTKTGQYAYNDSGVYTLWNSLAPWAASGITDSRFVGYFRYNLRNYWIALEQITAGPSLALVIYSDTGPIFDPGNPGAYGAGYEASLTRTEVRLYGLAYASVNSDDGFFKNFFMYKERLWIATSVGLYFSAATDPLNFAPPDGGFFKYPNDTVTYAIALKDTIYTFCDEAIYSLTYSTDPNVDATQRPISTSMGAEMACDHQGNIYFINNLGIFVINNNNIDKVMDSRFDYGTDVYHNKIYSFEQYLIILKYSPQLISSVAGDEVDNYWRGSVFKPFQGGNTLGYNCYFINTENGSTHVFDYVDQYGPGGAVGYITDGFVNNIKDSSGNYKWFFLTTKILSETLASLNYSTHVYYVSSSESNDVVDYRYSSVNDLNLYAPNIDIEIDSYVPDGLEYRMKKFRSLLIQGFFPNDAYDDKVHVLWAFDNEAYQQNWDDSAALYDDETGLAAPRRHYPHRIGLNQRGRSISIRFQNLWNTTINEALDFMEISDLRVMWTYIKNLPNSR